MNKREKPIEVKISKEEQDLIFKGIRSDDMEYVVFKQARKEIGRALKRYKGGKYKHISVNLDPLFEGKIKSEGTYVRTDKRRFEGNGRLWEKNKVNVAVT